VASIVIGRHRLDPAFRRNEAKIVQKFMNVFYLRGECFTLVLAIVAPMMPIILQHGAAAGYVDNDCIDAVHVESRKILIR
jgi:hypothetical protein